MAPLQVSPSGCSPCWRLWRNSTPAGPGLRAIPGRQQGCCFRTLEDMELNHGLYVWMMISVCGWQARGIYSLEFLWFSEFGCILLYYPFLFLPDPHVLCFLNARTSPSQLRRVHQGDAKPLEYEGWNSTWDVGYVPTCPNIPGVLNIVIWFIW